MTAGLPPRCLALSSIGRDQGFDQWNSKVCSMVMTAEMIEWSLLLLEWMKGSIFEHWPEVSLRGSTPEIESEGYDIRLRENGEEYWMVVHPDLMQTVPVEQAIKLLEKEDWIAHMKRTGCLHLGLKKGVAPAPDLHPCPYKAD
jgi:hypothetical protein